MKVKARGKSIDTIYPLWIYGEYMTEPPKRPKDGVVRPKGHYIDKGGYPGANVYEIDMDTFGQDTGSTDKQGKSIFEKDILIWENEEEITYFIIEDSQAIDVVSGEILKLQRLEKECIKVIGNIVDAKGFVENMQHHFKNQKPLPYIVCMDVQLSCLPYLRLQCEQCKKENYYCSYVSRCPDCGGFTTIGITKKYKIKALT